MGSNFYQSGFGKSFGKIAAQNPLNKLPSVFRGAPRLLDPSGKILKNSDSLDPMAKAANGYAAGQIVATSPTPFAGKQPTLADSNAMYVQAARKAAQPAVQIPNQQVPLAWKG